MKPALGLQVAAIAVALVAAVRLQAADEAAADLQPPPRAPAADGTTSVVVPDVDMAPPAAAVPTPAAGDRVSATPVPGVGATGSAPDESVALPAGAAAELLAGLLEPPAAASSTSPALYARPLPLLEALQRPGDPARRLWIAQAYWKVSAAFAALRWAGEAVERLEFIAPGGDPHDRAVLDVSIAAARADLAETRSQLGVAQQELVDLARLPITDPLPWPVDRPLASPYDTHFDAIFAASMATGRTRAIARTLPARHEAIESRAAAVTAAEKALAMAEADHAKGRRPIEAVVAAHAALVGQQREFIAAVQAYNLDIAEYAMAVADLSVADERFVSMLIGAPIAVRPAFPPAEPSNAVPPPVPAVP